MCSSQDQPNLLLQRSGCAAAAADKAACLPTHQLNAVPRLRVPGRCTRHDFGLSGVLIDDCSFNVWR